MKTNLFFFAIAYFGVSFYSFSQGYSGQDVLHYQFHVSLNETNDIVTVDERIDVALDKNRESILLDLDAYHVKSGRGMAVEYVLVNGDTAKYTHKLELLRVELEEPEDTVQLLMHYSGVPDDGLVISKNKFGGRTFFADHWPERAHHWLAVVDHPTEKATCEFVVETPKKYDVVANGDLVSVNEVGDYRKRTHWKMNSPIPAKVMVIGAAEFNKQPIDREGFSNAWIYQGGDKNRVGDFSQAYEIMLMLEDKIGNYPFSKLDHVESTTTYLGMENAGNIFYDEHKVQGKGNLGGLIAHEIAHQWFGNAISEISWRDIWLSESFAEYCTYFYIGEQYGKDSLRQALLKDEIKIKQYQDRYPSKTILVQDISEPEKILSPLVYEKGARVLRTLESLVGTEVFWDILNAYYEEFSYGNASTSDFIEMAERISSMSLNNFFHQWLEVSGQPELSVALNPKKRRLTIEQLTDHTYELSLDVRVLDKQGKTSTERISLTKKMEVIQLKTKKVRSVVIDPENYVFADIMLSND